MDVLGIPSLITKLVTDIWGMKYFIPLFVVLFIACSQKVEQEEITSEPTGMTIVNGVERSDLALLMRQMYEQMKLVSDSLESGDNVRTSFYDEYVKITSAHATEPEKIDELYQSMASAFLTNYKSFETSNEDQIQAFNIMVDNCLVCHQQKCPGPYKTIKKLKIKPV